jgi:2-polyprenyl-3-methyl-5-hydroxy-6-metoxy-1,4-benzoquinol methylase
LITNFLYCWGTFDTVYALNVVEHIKDDNLAISNAKKLLKHDGNIIILVPAYQALYNRFDIVLEHYRRYNEQRLNSLLSNHFTRNSFSIL